MIIPHVTADISEQFRLEAQPFIDKLMREHSGYQSFLDKGGIERGIIGELAGCRIIGAQRVDSYDWDCFYYGEPLDWKTCKGETTPHGHFWCKVAVHNQRQRCVFYGFNRIHPDLSRVYFLGTIAKWVFDRDKRFFEKDEPDPYPPHKPFPEACYAVEARILQHPISRYLKL